MLDRLYRRFHSGINNRLARWQGGRWAHFVRPSLAALLLTKRCNSRCLHCNLWQVTGPEENLGLKEWQVVLDDLRNWLGPVHVVLTGGEALLQPFTPELLRYGVSRGFFMELLTNGYRNDPELLKQVALADPAQITLSVDGVGEAHSKVRGRNDFWEHTSEAIATLSRLRRDHRLGYKILLKTVIMRQNLGNVAEVARYARQEGVELLYQPVEQNYGADEDPSWFDHAPTWPEDDEKAVGVVKDILTLKDEGFPILNSKEQLEVMIPYFRDPAGSQETVKAHTSHEDQPLCAAVSMLQIEPDGDVTICSRRSPVGNICDRPISDIWKSRPHWWRGDGCGIEFFCPCDPRRR
jgi:MoaA/NifB/PqqE/SkfB family radical SAM enzyme